VYLGYILGPQWEKAGELFSQYANFLLIPITLLIIWMIVKRRKINVQS
jgi:membrane protein DedA with SNARE-associated domain